MRWSGAIRPCSKPRAISGAGRLTAFVTITVPLALPGILAGSLLVLIPAIGEFVIPDLLGGSDTLMIGRTMWNDFFANRDWPTASAAAVVLVALLFVPIWFAERRASPRDGAIVRAGTLLRPAVLAAGFAFLYGPIALLVLYSFNASRLVTVWAGFSTRWYSALLADAQMIESAWISLVVALSSAAIATCVGGLAAFVLVRHRRAPGRSLFSLALHAPLVMPEVILGLSLLLVFVAAGIDRGLVTIILAHAAFTTCFVTVIVRAQLGGIDPALEEAARDLGATPFAAFRDAVLPLLVPALASGFLLAFTLSLDDLVIASFTSGPGATTLPMRIYSQVRLGVTPEINALSTLVLGAVGLALLCAALAMRRR